MKEHVKIRWAPPLRPLLLKQLYDSDAAGFHDIELCDEVGISLYARCQTFALVSRSEVVCPVCRTVFTVDTTGTSICPGDDCIWETTHSNYIQSIRNHNAHTGRALDAFMIYFHHYPNARTYQEKILLIDQLIHSFHINQKTDTATKSVASKLLEGNEKAVIRFLDNLSAIDPEGKTIWRRTVAGTIDRKIIRENVEGAE